MGVGACDRRQLRIGEEDPEPDHHQAPGPVPVGGGRVAAVTDRIGPHTAADDQARQLPPTIEATIGSSRFLMGDFSQFWQHTGEDFESKVLFVAQPVGSLLDGTDLVVEAFDEPQRYLVLFMAIGFDAIPMGFDHPGELLEGLYALPPESVPPLVEETHGPGRALVVPRSLVLPELPEAKRATSAVVQFQGDLRLGAVHHGVRNAGRAATIAIVRPHLGQEQLAVHQAVKIIDGITQVDRDDAVFLLADRAAVLPLNARRHDPFLDVAGFVNDADAVGTAVLAGHDFLQPLPHAVLVPGVRGKELLQGSRRHAAFEGDRFHALLGQVRQLPFHINRKVFAGVTSVEAAVEPGQILRQPGPQLANLLDVHVRNLLWATPPKVSPISLIYAMSKIAL